MPSAVVPKNAIAGGPGFLYLGALGVSLPANTVAGSVFTDNWPGGWSLLGITMDGSEFDYALTTADILAAEYYDPMQVVITARAASIKMSLMQIHATNMSRAINGGSLTTSGSGATQLNTYTPGAVGSEVRVAIGWEAQDSTERLVMEQCLQVGSLAIMRKKGAAVAEIGVEFRAEIPASGFPFRYWTAGTVRG
jgi:hypothetical protein